MQDYMKRIEYLARFYF